LFCLSQWRHGHQRRFSTSFLLSPYGFVRYFKGSIGSSAAALDVSSKYNTHGRGSIAWSITNVAGTQAKVSVLDAYAGNSVTRLLGPEEKFEDELSQRQFYGWYDLIVTVARDPTFNYRLALKPEGTASRIQLLGVL
jgi:phospholipase C